jgi:hypothetical protein
VPIRRIAVFLAIADVEVSGGQGGRSRRGKCKSRSRSIMCECVVRCMGGCYERPHVNVAHCRIINHVRYGGEWWPW